MMTITVLLCNADGTQELITQEIPDEPAEPAEPPVV